MRPNPLLIEQALTRAVTAPASSTLRSVSNTCRSCLQQQRQQQITPHATAHFASGQQRSFHVSARRRLDPNSFFGRLQATFTGKKERETKSGELVKAKQQAADEQLSLQQSQGGGNITRTIDGKEYEVAAVVDPAVNKDYEAANVMDFRGAPRIGGEQWLMRQEAAEGEQYRGYGRSKRTLTEEEITALLWSTVREALERQAAGKSPVSGPVKLRTKRAPADIFTDVHGHLRLNVNKDGKPTRGDEWMHLKISDPSVKLAIAKRLLQRTGTRLPDRTIYGAETCAELQEALQRQLKVKSTKNKLAYADEIVALADAIPNVTVHARRRKPRDVDEELGRGKMIRKALQQKGLLRT